MEIERKFLVKQIPVNLEKYTCKVISQSYISTSPTIRIRQSDDIYYLTVKTKDAKSSTTVREEFEINISKEDYYNLLKKAENKEIKKKRYLIPLDGENIGLTSEFDVYEDYLNGLFTVEVEFISEYQCNNFIPPNWFGKDVSGDYRYRNSNLSKIDSVKELI